MDDPRHETRFDRQAAEAMKENGFEPDFPPDAIEQLRTIEESAVSPPGDIRDMRDVLWSSIDNATSRDLDQIEWAEQLENGDIRVLVGIADVDAMVAKDTPIDRHAAFNTVTVYTQTRIFPMLPEELSTGITSLNEGEDRLAVVAGDVVDDPPGRKGADEVGVVVGGQFAEQVGGDVDPADAGSMQARRMFRELGAVRGDRQLVQALAEPATERANGTRSTARGWPAVS